MIIENNVLKSVSEEDIKNGTLIIPEGVTGIGSKIFDSDSKRNSVTIVKLPNSLKEIGGYAFLGCRSLTSINIPDGVTIIGYNAFCRCRSLTSINIPDGVTIIGYGAFEGCSSLTSINIPEEITNIDDNMFAGCYSLTNIIIPKTVTNIGERAFYGCSSLTSINIPKTVTNIDRYAFAGCSDLTSINIPEEVTNIDECVFDSCSSLTNVNIENSLKNENVLYQLYDDLDVIDSQLMFGNDLDRFYRIKSQAHFNLSEDYDKKFMNELYHKIIFSIGIDELERMVKIPGLDGKQLDRYEDAFKEKEEKFKNLYEEKQILSGDFGTVVRILKQLAFEVNINEKGNKNEELTILRKVNELLEDPNSNIISLKELIVTAMQNAGYNSLKIEKNVEELQRALNKSQFQKNIDNVREDIINVLSTDNVSFGEQIAVMQVEPIEKIIEDKLRKIYMSNSIISVNNLKEELLEELRNDSHAIYIRQNAENIVNRFLNLLENNEDFRKKINYNSIDALKTIKMQIGEKWINKIKQAFKEICDGQNIESIPDKYSTEQINILKTKLDIDIETETVAVLKKGADRKEAYKLLKSVQESLPESEQLIVTYKQLHDMFGGVHSPYSEEFKKFYKLHREEFLRNTKYIHVFATICNNFETIVNSPELKNIYLNGKLQIDDIIGYMSELTFGNQREGDEKLAKLSSSIGKIVTDEQFEDVQKFFDIVKERERASIPPVLIQDKKSKFRGRILSPNDILTMFVGNITDCCQKFGDVGIGAMLLGAIEENAGIFVVEELQEDGSYQIIGQSLTIRQKGKNGNNDRLTFDNIEITKNVKEKLSETDELEILRIYQEAGNKAINLDRKFLMNLLELGKISQEDFDNLVLKEVIVGRGYNDLGVLDTLPVAETIVPKEAYFSYRSKEFGTNEPWIDSTEQGAPTGSNSYKPVIIAQMDINLFEQINKRREKSIKKVSNLSTIPLWYGKVDESEEFFEGKIGEKQIETIKSIERKVYRTEQQLLNNEEVRNWNDLKDTYELEDVSVVIGSEQNWYMIYGTGFDGECKIQDIALEGGVNSYKNKNTLEEQNASRLATAEMANALLTLMLQKAKEGTKIVCNATKDTSLINIKSMIKKGIIEVCDFDGKKIIISSEGKLIYENGNEVSYREFENQNFEKMLENDEPIQMLDLEIKPNLERMIEEKIKTENYLQLARKAKRIKGVGKKERLDDMRREIRDDLEKEK